MLRTTIGLAAIAMATGVAGQPSQQYDGRWVGEAFLNGASMPIELEVTGNGPTEVILYLPELVNRQSLKARSKPEGLEIDMPFGLGSQLLIPSPEGHVLATAPKSLGITVRKTPPDGFRVEEVTVQASTGGLPATLYLPAKAKQASGVVIAGGATAQSRHHVSVVAWCHHFVRRRLACLVTDRRPDASANSGRSDLERDSGELRDALNYLRSRPEVDPERVGLASFSRGGWPALRVASQDSKLAFLFASALPTLSPGESEKMSARAKITAAGRPASEIAAVVSYYDLYFDVAGGRKPWAMLDKAARRAEQASWGKFVDQPLKPEHLGFWSRNASFDNMQDFARVKAPILAVWGGSDLIVPPAVHEPLLSKHFTAAKSVETVVYRDADHPVEVQPGPDALGKFRWPSKAPGLIAKLDTWLQQRVGRPARMEGNE